MNRKYYAALAVSAATVGMVVLTSTEASATRVPDPPATHTSAPAQTVPNGWPDESSGFPTSTSAKSGLGHQQEPNYGSYDANTAAMVATTKSAAASSHDGTATEVLRSGASALGGAAVALSCVWLYRRHQLRTT